jgi:hypothetical protein
MNRNVYHAWDWAGENWSVEFHFRKAVGLAAVLRARVSELAASVLIRVRSRSDRVGILDVG